MHTLQADKKIMCQKPQNENICLACLNEENNGNFPILAFRDCTENVANG